ncbi:hypothetical protein [Anaerolactibacter massiliensis]|uniref:hypothetical protein n=1 Tax=Anaerolactibacter massiliensis TaxID=2044573 RepID=UPI000CF9F6FD|nr:hypothetical protein [Anaerolactibacter massiliensis]
MSNSLLREFRQECKNYRRYLEERDEVLKKLYLTQVKIDGVHSIDTAEPHTQCNAESSVLIKFETKDKLLEKLDEVNNKIRVIEDTIRKIDYPFYRVVAWEKFVMNQSYKTIAKMYDVDSENLRKRVNNALLEVIYSNASQSAETLKK